MMRAVRSLDGFTRDLEGHLPPNATLEGLYGVLSELYEIPVEALIIMHPSGRQVDRETLHGLLESSTESRGDAQFQSVNDPNATGTVYLFDRELLELDLDSETGLDFMKAMTMDVEHVLATTSRDPGKQLEATLEMIGCIRHQRAALVAAVLNLERHRGGRQEGINAYKHFASPVLNEYRNLLSTYPSSIALVSRIKVSRKTHNPKSLSDTSSRDRDRCIVEYVSLDKMDSVKDGCKKTLDEIQRKDKELESILKSVNEGTEQLRLEMNEDHLEDLDECERDAREAYTRALDLLSDSHTAGDAQQELADLDAEAVERLHFLVPRKNVETHQLVNSLQRIAGLQSQIAATSDLITALHHDLRTKCDGFKHLTRLHLLVPSYAASMAEAIRRRLFNKLLTASSSSFAELYGKLTAEEKKRRGVYQAEWAGKLPWETPGLDQAVLGLEVELRSSSASLPPASKDERQTYQQEITIEDLDALGTALAEIEDGLSPEDMPAGGLLHSVREAINLVAKFKKQISDLQQEFDKLSARMDDTQDDVTSVSVSVTDNAALRAVEEKRIELERELQAERGSREQETAELNFKIAELQRSIAEMQRSESDHQQIRKAMDTKLQEAIVRAEKAEAVQKDTTVENAYCRGQLDSVQTRLEEAEAGASETQRRLERAQEQQREALEALGEKERLLREHQSEAEIDKATLEKELNEEKERATCLIQDIGARLKAAEVDSSGLRESLSMKENQIADLEGLCKERLSSIADLQGQLSRKEEQDLELIKHTKTLYEGIVTFLADIVNERIPLAPASSSRPRDTSLTEIQDVDNPAYVPPAFNDSSAEEAIRSLVQLDTSIVEQTKQKIRVCVEQPKRWQRECRKHKDRAEKAIATLTANKDKLAFRKFAKNDLVLFLPTRNANLEEVFAAFNVNWPNHFLDPTGDMVDLVKTREWIIARITEITEYVVESNDSDGNPYSLQLGSKYFKLRAEPWKRGSGSSKAKETPSAPKDDPSLQTVPSAPSESMLKVETDAPSQKYDAPQVEGIAAAQSDTDRHRQSPPTSLPLTSAPGPAELAGSAYTLINESSGQTPRPEPHQNISAPLPASSLTAQRPARLSPVLDQQAHLSPLPSISPINRNEGKENIISRSIGEAAPAFLPSSKTIPRRIVRSATTSQALSTSIPRSFSSGDSHSYSSSINKRMRSSNYLMSMSPSKAPATTSTTSSSMTQERSWSPPSRSTQTIGRYSGKKGSAARREASSPALASQSSVADLLRSITDGL